MADPSDPKPSPERRDPAWQSSAAAMDRWQLGMAGAGAAATALMLEKAAIRPGSRVLEVGAGTGNETMLISGIVGPDGYVLATDISEDMVAAARRKFDEAGCRNAEAQVMDAATLAVAPESFDSALCRMALMLFPDPAGALRGMFAALRQDGHMAAMIFSTPERNPLQAISMKTIRDRLGLAPPAPDTPGYFSLAADGVLPSMMERAGFVDVGTERVAGERQMTPPDIRTYVTQRSGGTRTLLASIDDTGKEDILRAIEDAMAPFEQGDVYVLPHEFLVAAGRKPS